MGNTSRISEVHIYNREDLQCTEVEYISVLAKELGNVRSRCIVHRKTAICLGTIYHRELSVVIVKEQVQTPLSSGKDGIQL